MTTVFAGDILRLYQICKRMQKEDISMASKTLSKTKGVQVQSVARALNILDVILSLFIWKDPFPMIIAFRDVLNNK